MYSNDLWESQVSTVVHSDTWICNDRTIRESRRFHSNRTATRRFFFPSLEEQMKVKLALNREDQASFTSNTSCFSFQIMFLPPCLRGSFLRHIKLFDSSNFLRLCKIAEINIPDKTFSSSKIYTFFSNFQRNQDFSKDK